MDTTKFDAVARHVASGTTRRQALRGLMAGVAAVTAGSSLLAVEDAAARKKQRKNKKKKKKLVTAPTPASDPASQPVPPPNPCEGKNWCVDRSQTCGPAGGYGKCLVEAGGDNICGELLFQAATCADCAPANCTNCRCVLAAGGGDRCNNGPTGQDFVCVRPV